MITTEAVVLAAARPLISREEHLLGEKVLPLVFKWGETVAVRIAAVGWKRLRAIAALDLPHHDHVDAIVRESVGPQLNLDHLDQTSMALLTSHCLAFAFGEAKPKSETSKAENRTTQERPTRCLSGNLEGEDPNARPAGMPALPVAETGSTSAGDRELHLSGPAFLPERLTDGPLLD